MSIYKSCDIRGRFGSELLPEHATRLGAAIADMIGPTRLIVGGDGRLSTPQLKAMLIAALLARGCDVVDIGIVPTPAFYFARERLAIKPGIMVTASHNPAEDNGFKVILGDMPVREADIQQIQALIESPPAAREHPAGTVTPAGILPDYIQAMRSLAPKLAALRVVLDCANGMAALAAPEIWRATGAEIHLINDEVDGAFPAHPPDPARMENLIQLAQNVHRHGADLGVAYDGDSDRVAFVDDLGVPLSPDKAIAIFAANALNIHGPAPVVFDQKCSRLVAEMISGQGGTPIREKSGHTFIKTAFIKSDALYAGELSGHHFFRAIHGDDGIYASMKMGEIISSSGRSLAALAAELPTYAITPDLRIRMSAADIDRVLLKLEAYFAGRGTISTVDGIRVEVADGWGLARRSVTEPVITLRFEGRDEQALHRLLECFAQAAPELADDLQKDCD